MENTKLCVLPVSKSVWMKICQNTNTRSSNMNNSLADTEDSLTPKVKIGRKPTPIVFGQNFSKLTYIVDALRKSNRREGIFLCECGNLCTIRVSSVIAGVTRSCGCLLKEGNNASHRKSYTAEHNISTDVKKM